MLYGMGRLGPVVFFADLGVHQLRHAGKIIPVGRIPKRMGRPNERDARFLWQFAQDNPISPLNGRRTSGLGICLSRLRRLALRLDSPLGRFQLSQ